MRNIILNAIQAMPGGGALTIAIRADASSDCALIEFRDTGIGIPNEKLDEIFQPFVTTKTKGTGLGLSIVRKIVENHDGTIQVSSRRGSGTTFTVALPAQQSGKLISDDLRRLTREKLAAVLPDL